MKTSLLATSVALLCPTLVLAQATQPAARRPNIIVIVADDLGYADLGVQGGKDVKTPNIDALAAAGTRFTNGYVSCPVCSPTRAGLLTGRYQQRFGFYENPGPGNADVFGLPTDERTIADQLKLAGYHTGLVGKWHLGTRDEMRPPKRGFDEFFGFLGGAHKYINNSTPADGANAIRRGDTPVAENEYLTDALGREAVSFVERNAGAPFFLYLAFNAVHTPQQVPQAYLDRVHAEPGAGEERIKMLAMLAAADDSVGKLTATLRARGLDENTLVFFHSDNGGPPTNGTSNAPLRGFKRDTLEGGIRVPFIVKWPGTIPAGKVDDRPVIQLDISATTLAVAGAPLPPKGIDGRDLLPFLTGKDAGAVHDALFWSLGERKAVRAGEWKLQWSGDGQRHLYRLPTDAGEATDVASAHPDVVKQLTARFDEWSAQLAKPRWTGNFDTDDEDEAAAGRGANLRERRAARAATRPATTSQPTR